MTTENPINDPGSACLLGLAEEQQGMRYVMMVDRQPALAQLLTDILDDPSIRVLTTADWRLAKELLITGRVHLLICDLDLPAEGAAELFADLLKSDPAWQRNILFSRSEFSQTEPTFGDLSLRRELLRKPFRNDQVLSLVTRRLERPAVRMVHG